MRCFADLCDAVSLGIAEVQLTALVQRRSEGAIGQQCLYDGQSEKSARFANRSVPFCELRAFAFGSSA